MRFLVRAGGGATNTAAGPLCDCRAHTAYAAYAILSEARHIDHIRYAKRFDDISVKKLVNLTEEQARQIADYRSARAIASENEAIRSSSRSG